MSFCPLCKSEHPEGDALCPAKSLAEKPGSACTIPDADAAAPTDPLIGQKLGHWVVMRKIGEGAMGYVYAAKDPVSGAQVAVKILRLDEVNCICDEATRQRCLEEVKERFRREAEVATKVGQNQPNIVQILGFGTLNDKRPYFVMEFLYGRSLAARIDPTAPTRRELRRWFEQVCDALWVIHDAGVVHRDLKPENIWICQPRTGESSAKLLDFGISKIRGVAGLTSPGAIPGTALYLAPERLAGKSDDPRSDIYAMGVILYEVLTGRTPFVAETIEHLYSQILSQPPSPLVFRGDLAVSPKLERLILDCLAKRPEDRPQTALDLKARVLEALEDEAEAPAGTHAPRPAPSAQLPGPETKAALAGMARARQGRMVLLVGGLAVLGVGGVMAWMIANRTEKPMVESSATTAVPMPTAAVAPVVPVPPAPSVFKPDAGTNMVRKIGSRPRPSDKPVAAPLPASLQPEPLRSPPAQALAAPAPAKATPVAPSRHEHRPPAPLPPLEPAPAPVQARAREVVPSKSSKPSKAEIDLITNEQILLGN